VNILVSVDDGNNMFWRHPD